MIIYRQWRMKTPSEKCPNFVVQNSMATDEEKAQLIAWKKYRVLLNRVDTSLALDIDWPEKP
ncbi:tail fiber assembly protein, partial [Providencia rettgeri]